MSCTNQERKIIQPEKKWKVLASYSLSGSKSNAIWGAWGLTLDVDVLCLHEIPLAWQVSRPEALLHLQPWTLNQPAARHGQQRIISPLPKLTMNLIRRYFQRMLTIKRCAFQTPFYLCTVTCNLCYKSFFSLSYIRCAHSMLTNLDLLTECWLHAKLLLYTFKIQWDRHKIW